MSNGDKDSLSTRLLSHADRVQWNTTTFDDVAADLRLASTLLSRPSPATTMPDPVADQCGGNWCVWINPNGAYAWAFDGPNAETKARSLAKEIKKGYDQVAAALSPLATTDADALIERCARIIERRAEDRVHSTASYDESTNAWEYPKHAEDVGNALDEEADDCAKAIRALKGKP